MLGRNMDHMTLSMGVIVDKPLCETQQTLTGDTAELYLVMSIKETFYKKEKHAFI